jgi:phage tail sheath protein FI
LGNSNYINNVIYNNSKYIYSVSAQTTDLSYATWGRPLANTSYYVQGTNSFNLTGGSDDVPSTANTQTAYGLFANADETNVSLVITGDAPIATQQYVIDNLVNSRKDCLAFISPPSANVVNQAGNETTNITAWNTALGRSTSYAVADSGWKYMFDKYNNTYRWVPLNGDIAGLCVYTDSVRDPWFSPAGFNRGNLKNVVKLAWNPTKTNRDTLYAQGVNPVGTFPGNGTVLYGDKTLQTKPSAFDRINVRRLFIVLEKAISQAAKYSLFEFNDESTRAQFVGLVTPFLRDIQGRRGIYDFRVVCDTTNNTSQVIDSNQFVGDIYIKPARSINFIQLNFVAVRTGVDFTEVVGKF